MKCIKGLGEFILGQILIWGGLLLLVVLSCAMSSGWFWLVLIGCFFIYVIYKAVKESASKENSPTDKRGCSQKDEERSFSKSVDLWGDGGWDDSGDGE